MNLRTLLLANLTAGFTAAVGLLLVPNLVAELFGLTLDAPGSVFARLGGAVLLGFNVTSWIALNVGPAARRAVAAGHAVHEAAAAAVLVVGLLSGLGNGAAVALLVVACAWAILLAAAAFGLLFADDR